MPEDPLVSRFWDRIIRARAIVDAHPYVDVSNKTDPQVPCVHWRTAGWLAQQMPDTYKFDTPPGSPPYRHIRNIRLHPVQAGVRGH